MPDPDAPLPNRERRRTVRQRLHTPVYVSFNSPQSGAVLDLSELLDLHEHGFAVQTAIPTALSRTDRLEVNRAVTLCLDLPETKKYVHGSGQVMWTDDTGRAGIRFSFLPDPSRQALKEWLFANLLVASTNHVARIRQLEQHRQESRASEWVGAQAGMPQQPDGFGQHPVIQRASQLSVPDRSHLARNLIVPANVAPTLRRERTRRRTLPMRAPDPKPIEEPSRSADRVPEHVSDQRSVETAAPISDSTELISALDDVRRQIRQMQESAGEAANRRAVLETERVGAVDSLRSCFATDRRACRKPYGRFRRCSCAPHGRQRRLPSVHRRPGSAGWLRCERERWFVRRVSPHRRDRFLPGYRIRSAR